MTGSTTRPTLRGTFAGPGPWNGIEPTGARLEIPGADCFVVADEKIVRNEAYVDGMTVGRQMGLLPEQDSAAEQRMTSLFNTRTKAITTRWPNEDAVSSGFIMPTLG